MSVSAVKTSMLMQNLVRQGCMARSESAILALAKVDCVLLKLPWGGQQCQQSAAADVVQQLRAKGVSILFCFEGSATEATAAVEEFVGADAGTTLVKCSLKDDWTSILSHLAGDATLGTLTEISTASIPEAVQALQSAGHIVLYYGFTDEETLAVETAAVGFASGSSSDALKSASGVIAINSDFGCLPRAIDASRSSAKSSKECCAVQ